MRYQGSAAVGAQYMAKLRPATACFWVKATWDQKRRPPGNTRGTIPKNRVPPRPQTSQNAFGQGLIVLFDTDAGVLEKALHALLETVSAPFQGARRDNLPHLQTLAAQDPHGHCRQIHNAGQRLQGQVTVQLVGQVGKHFILWFDHYCLRGVGCSLRGYDRSRPLPRRLFPSYCYRFFYCPLVRGLAPSWKRHEAAI